MSDTIDTSRLWRERPSSEGQPPRVLIRVYVEPGRLVESIRFHEDLQGVAVDAVFPFPDVGIVLATVGAFLILEGDDHALAPFRATVGTMLVDHVGPYHAWHVAAGSEIVVPLRDVPTGASFSARHPDGTVVEYVHHRPDVEGR